MHSFTVSRHMHRLADRRLRVRHRGNEDACSSADDMCIVLSW